MEETFTYIYENKIWGNNYNNSYKGSSGEGSSINYNKEHQLFRVFYIHITSFSHNNLS